MAKSKELSLEKCFVKNKVQKRLKLINFSEIQITESFCCFKLLLRDEPFTY